MHMIHYIKTSIVLILLLAIPVTGFAQETAATGSGTISGTVMDAAFNQPVYGANVSAEDSISTFTDQNGKFEIPVSDPNSHITISADGYARQIVPLKGRNEITVHLNEEGFTSFHSDVNLDYTTKPHLYTTQAVEQARFEDEAYKTPGTSAEYLFSNAFAGLSVTNRSGMPANGSLMSIWGMNSLNASNAPLIIVDGMISEFNSKGKQLISGAAYNSLAGISIDDIEAVTVLKDGTSIYGSQGGNGVILIETLRAREAVTKIQFSTYRGIRYAPQQIPVMDAANYRIYLSEILQSRGLSSDSIQSLPYMIDDPEYRDYNTYHNEINWQDHIYQDGTVENYNLKIKGGDNIALYGLSLGYMGNQGIVRNTSFERYSIRFNSEINLSQKAQILANISWVSGLRNLKDDGVAPVTNPAHLAMTKAPFLYFRGINQAGDISPRYEDADILGVSNPVALIDNMTAVQRNNATNASVKVNYTLTDKLTLSNRLGINYFKSRFNTFVPHVGVADYVSDLGVIENTMENKVESKFVIFNDLRAAYELYLDANQSVFAVAGMRTMVNQTEEDWAEAHNSPNDELRSIGRGVRLFNEFGGYIGNWNTQTYYAQVDYDFNKKYFATAGLSLDGSSRFGDKANGIPLIFNRFAIFPSLTTAWLISSETFMQNVEAINLARLRLGITMAGNGDIGNFASSKYYVAQNLMGAYGLVSGNLYNPDLQWESNDLLNMGLDLGLFNDRISVAANLFRKQTRNLLTVVHADYYVGYDTYLTNFGNISTSGFDLNLNTRIINRRIKWDAGIKLQKYSTTVNEYFGDQEIMDVYGGQVLIREGEPLGQFYGYKALGVFASDQDAADANLKAEMPNSDLVPFQAGDVIFDDVDDNNIINELDRQVIGNPDPDIAGNVFTRLGFGGLSIDATISFSYGNDVYNHLRRQLESLSTWDNQTQVALNRWQVQDQATEIPRAAYGDPMGNARFSDRWIEDGSYIRLYDVTVSYRLPLHNLINQTFDIFVTGQNLVTLTNYLGMDPEFSLGGSPLVRGIDVGMTPQPKAVFAGIRIGL